MDELSAFVNRLAPFHKKEQLSCDQARAIVKSLNEFLYTNYSGIGTTKKLGQEWTYISDFHKYWEAHHKEILDCKIVEEKCVQVADALHNIFELTAGKAFGEVWNTCGLSKDDICRVRILTANQDFRGSRDLYELAEIFKNDPGIFEINSIYDNPEDFVKSIKVAKLSQNDKRISYAKNFAQFLIKNDCYLPSDLLSVYNNDLFELRKAIIACKGAGYGNKKTDMMLRDMVVLGVWDNGKNFDKIDVASDVNTIKIALRTGIIQTAIPLVSSFLDIFCYQYSHIEEMNAKAWRRVWQIWCENYPNDNITSPCLLDYFIYNVVGKQFCKEFLFTFECDEYGHQFKWHSGQNKTCQLCLAANKHKRVKAHKISKVMPCTDKDNSYIAISKTAFAQSLPAGKSIGECPFIDICDKNRYLEPPTSISILGETGWTTAYANKDNGGGGLMA